MNSSNNKSIVENSGFSAEGKEILNKSFTEYSTTKLVDDVNRSKISAGEKEILLKILAINFNLVKPNLKSNPTSTLPSKGPNADYHLVEYSPEILESNSLRGNAVIWGGVGFIVGNGICGSGCGVVGGIIGLVFGQFSNSSNTTFGSHQTNSGGSSPTP